MKVLTRRGLWFAAAYLMMVSVSFSEPGASGGEAAPFAQDSFDIEEFVNDNCLVDGSSAVLLADGVLSSDETAISARGEEVEPPYARFRFAFLDDCPGANWAHSCRYLFISEDGASFTVLDMRWMPRLWTRSTGERIRLRQCGGESPSDAVPNATAMEGVCNAVYASANTAVANGISYRLGDKSKSYFVLISGGLDPESNGIRFWSDTAMMYSTLRLKYGVPKSNIKVYMSDGKSTGKDANLGTEYNSVLVDSPWDLDGDGSSDISGPASFSAVKSCFSGLSASLTSGDQLFVFITSHGDAVGTPGPNNYNCEAELFSMEYRDAYFTDKDLASWTKGIKCPVAFAIETCYSGGFIGDLTATPKRVVATACNHNEYSWGRAGGGEWKYSWQATGAYNGWAAPFISALRGFKPYPYSDYGYPWRDYSSANADSNGDGKVSFNEARIYAYNHDEYRCTRSSHPAWCSYNYVGGSNSSEHPQYGENPKGFGASFFVLKQNGKTAPPALFASGKKATAFAGDATYSGWVRDSSGAIAGLLTVKAAKARNGKSKLSVAYTPTGGKKQTIRLANDAMPDVGKVATVTLPGVGTVKFTGDAITGVNVDVQAGRDVVNSKDRDEKSKAAAFVAARSGAWTFALGTGSGYAAFSLTVDKKGKGKLTGTLPDGTKVSASSQGVIGDSALAIPFTYSKKGSLGFVFWAKTGGAAEISDLVRIRLPGGAEYTPSPVAPSMTHRLSDGTHTFKAGGVSQSFTVAGKKWNVPRQDKRAEVDPNPSGLKLAFTEKTGAVKGTFTVVSGKAKNKYTIVGMVVNSVFYGSACAKNLKSLSATAK